MDDYHCPRCNEMMDQGHISFSGSPPGNVSDKQTGMLRKAAAIRLARACPNFGYVEMYLDPNELKKNIS